MVQGELVLVELTEDRANVEVGVCLDLGSLKSGLDGQRLLQEVQGSAHLADATVVAGHVVESHRHTKLIRVTQLLRLLQQVKSGIDVFFFEVVNSEDVADLT